MWLLLALSGVLWLCLFFLSYDFFGKTNAPYFIPSSPIWLCAAKRTDNKYSFPLQNCDWWNTWDAARLRSATSVLSPSKQREDLFIAGKPAKPHFEFYLSQFLTAQFPPSGSTWYLVMADENPVFRDPEDSIAKCGGYREGGGRGKGVVGRQSKVCKLNLMMSIQ